MKILIAIDGSKYGRHAVAYLTRHRDQFKSAEVTLVNVHHPIPGRAASYLDRTTVNDYYRDEADRAFKTVRSALNKSGIAFKEVAKVGEPGDEVSAMAKRGKFDLVIMGSHGHGLFANLVLGSVTTKVLSGCKVPVLVVR